MLQKIEISHRTIIFTVLFLVFLWLLFQIRQIILALFVALILMAALNPLVNKLERLRLPRAAAALLTILFVVGGLGLTLGLTISPLIEQTAILVTKFPRDLPYFRVLGSDASLLVSQFVEVGKLPAELVKLTFSFLSNLVGILAIFVITFYLLLERKNLDQYLVILFGESEKAKAKMVIDKIELRLGSWVRGQAVLMIIVGLMDFVGLKLLGIEFALPVAILGGLLEIVPNIGPTVATIPAILAGLTVSLPHAAAAAGWYFLVQQTENSIIVPKVMQKAAGVYPLVTILSLAVGFKLGGVVGAILAVPVFLTLQVIWGEVLSAKVSAKT